MDASQFWNDPLEFSTAYPKSTATMFDLLGQTKILCLVILPEKDSSGLYRGDKILKKDWTEVFSMRDPFKLLGYENKPLKLKTGIEPDYTNDGFPFNHEYPIMYEKPVVKYAFYAHTLDDDKKDMYALIGSNGTSKRVLREVKDTCLPFPQKMKEDLPYNPEQFPNCIDYPKNRNPTLVEFSKFLQENPTVGCFYVKYDDGPEMRQRRSDETTRDHAAAVAAAERHSLHPPTVDPRDSSSQEAYDAWEKKYCIQKYGQNYGQQSGGGDPKYVVPTITANLFEFSHNPEYTPPTSGSVSDRYILDGNGVRAFTKRIEDFYDEFFGDEYQKNVKGSINAMVQKRLKKYEDAIQTAIELDMPGLIPKWLLDEADKNITTRTRQNYIDYINDYLNKYFNEENPVKGFSSLLNRVTGKNDELKSSKMRIDKKRDELRSAMNLKYIQKQFETDAILQFPDTLSEVNTGIAGLMRNEEVIKNKYTKLLASFCCLFFDKSFVNVLTEMRIDFNTFEIFRESNNPNSNLLKAMCKVIKSIGPLSEKLSTPDVASASTVPGTDWTADFTTHTLPVTSATSDTSRVASDSDWVADFRHVPIAPAALPVPQATPPVQANPPGLFWQEHADTALKAGGGIGKPYGKKNRKRYSRKRYSRKRYSRKNRKRYSGKNRKRYSGKNKKRYSKKNQK